MAFLVMKVNQLAIETKRQMGGRHSRKSAGFVRACVAYAYITIPSIVDWVSRFQLYLQSAAVALQNNCLPQADAILKSVISMILDVPKEAEEQRKIKSNEPLLAEWIQNLLSLLLVVPDSPEQGKLYLFKGLMNAVEKRQWSTAADHKANLYVSMLGWVATASLPDYCRNSKIRQS